MNKRIPHNEAIMLYSMGYTDKEIANTLGFNSESVYRWRKRFKIPTKHISGKTPIPHDKALMLYKAGFTDVDIAKALGYKSNSVSRWRNRHCLPTNQMIGRPPIGLIKRRN